MGITTPLKQLFFLSTLLFIQCLTCTARANSWEVIQEQSEIGFTAFYDKQPFHGIFHQHDTHIRFNPADLSNSQIECEIVIASTDTQSRDRDDALKTQDWFDSEQYPVATFQSTQITQLNDNQYTVSGLLQLKGTERAISFPFTWNETSSDEKLAVVRAHFTLDRRDYHIGDGDWATDETIGFKVQVALMLKLRSADH